MSFKSHWLPATIAAVMLYIVIPSIPRVQPVLALSAGDSAQQHFDTATLSHWSAKTDGNCGSSNGSFNQSAPLCNDTQDVSPATAGLFTTVNSNPCGVTLTYTDPVPQAVSSQRYIFVNIYSLQQETVQMAVSIDTGMAVTVTNNNIVNCNNNTNFCPPGTPTPAPIPSFVGSTQNPQWYTVYMDTTAAGFPAAANIVSVALILPNGNGSMDTSGFFVDNLQGSNTWISNCGSAPPIPPTNTNTPTSSPTPTFTNSPTPTPTNTASNSPTNTPTDTFTNSPTSTPTPTFTNTASNSPTNSPTNTPPNTPTNTGTSTVTNTATLTPTVTDTFTATSSATNSPTSTPTFTPTNTSPFTATNTSTNTNTGTPTNTATSTFTFTPTFTFTLTDTNTLGPTATNTPTNSTTSTPTNTNTLTPTFTSTNTFTLTDTSTPTNTATNTNTPTFTFTPTVTLTPTDTFTPGPTATFTATRCPISVYPNPMDFQAPHNIAACPGSACIVLSCIPDNSVVKIYTVSLLLVRAFHADSTDPNFSPLSGSGVGTITWDGRNGDANPVSSGFYLYVVEPPTGDKSFGKFAISRSW